jgi:hypothetical protein
LSGFDGALAPHDAKFQKRLMNAKKDPAAGVTELAADPGPDRPQDGSSLVPASQVLQEMLDSLPPDHFTLGWLSSHLHRRSFGVIVLVLALIAMVPGVSYIAGLLLFAPAFEMIAGRSAPTFPGWIANRSLPTRHLVAAVKRGVPILIKLEKVIQPRWHMPLQTTKRLVGVAVLLLTLLLLLTPLPFIQVVPGAVIVTLSVAYLEDDGLLLSLGLLITLALLTASAGAVWGTIVALS